MLTNKEAQELISNGNVEIDGVKISDNCIVSNHSEIKVKGKVERPRKEFVYLKFYKPLGFESTLNSTVADNLSGFFKEFKDLSIAGRLDKQSEGLLLLSNDGNWVESLCNPKFEKEKEYLVTLDKNPDDGFINSFSKGVLIGEYVTKSCYCEVIENSTLRIILTEGKNRQIRRMCWVLGYRVMELKRNRIANYLLEDLKKR